MDFLWESDLLLLDELGIIITYFVRNIGVGTNKQEIFIYKRS